MGFLNHSTNNIIIDAVLTEVGREALAEGGIRSQITHFRLGDDEIDYSILKQYGLTIGKEKIEKNTPIFEAITDDEYAIKYPVRDLDTSTSTISVFPKLVLEDTSASITISSNEKSVTDAVIKFKSSVTQDDDFVLSSLLIDNNVTVKVVDNLLKLKNRNDEVIEGDFKVYNVKTSDISLDFTNQVEGSFVITSSGVVTDSTYKYYSTSSDSTKIKTQIEITGRASGAKLIIPVTIQSSTITSN